MIKFTILSLPLFGLRRDLWSFGEKQILPQIKKSVYYTEDAEHATHHIIPHPYFFDRNHDFIGVLQHLNDNYRFWNDTRKTFLYFQFCDVFIDCDHIHVPMSRLPDAFNPSSPRRGYAIVSWNGLADGGSGGECINCFQRGIDIQMPTAHNACGFLCGGISMEQARRYYLWNSTSPKNLAHALLFAKSFAKRRHRVSWIGRVPPGTSPDNDISARYDFFNNFKDKTGWFVKATYDYVQNKPTPLAIPIVEIMLESDFCYSPLGGLGGDTDRYIPALFSGCIPIMLKSVRAHGRVMKILQPFEDIIDWSKIAVLIDYYDIPNLPQILAKVDIVSKRAHVYDVWPKLLYTVLYGSHLGEDDKHDAISSLVQVLANRGGAPPPPPRGASGAGSSN